MGADNNRPYQACKGSQGRGEEGDRGLQEAKG